MKTRRTFLQLLAMCAVAPFASNPSHCKLTRRSGWIKIKDMPQWEGSFQGAWMHPSGALHITTSDGIRSLTFKEIKFTENSNLT